LEIIDKDEQRCPFGKSLQQARQRSQEAGGGKGPVNGRWRQVGVPLANCSCIRRKEMPSLGSP